MFRHLLYQHVGISLTPEKQMMVAFRLAKRLNHYQLSNYLDYYHIATAPDNVHEFQTMVNILTTNETYFFREPQHFEFIQQRVLNTWRGQQFRIWSAACSSGEEAYSLAMVLAECSHIKDFEVFASDISTKVLSTAETGIYPLDRLEHLDPRLLKKYCLKGVNNLQGYFRIDANLRKYVNFQQLNLITPLPAFVGSFDIIFLRNVLIYFDLETRQKVVEQLANTLKMGGYFIVSHSESLHHVYDKLKLVSPSIYLKESAN